MKKGIRVSLGFKFSAAIMLASMLISALILFLGYQLYTQQITERYTRQGEALINTVSKTIDWNKVDFYYQTHETDNAYWATLEKMRRCAEASDAKYLFVVKPEGEGAVFIFDTDESETRCDLGEFRKWREGFGSASADLQQGKPLGPITTKDEYGWLLSVYVPFTNSQGQFVGYLGVDYAAQHIANEQWAFIGTLIMESLVVSLIMTALFLFVIRSLVVRPINTIAHAANSYLVEQNAEFAPSSSITQLNIKTHDELQSLSESLKAMEEKIQNYIKNLEVATARADIDPMTTLYKREAFERQVSEILAAGSFDGYFVFMMIDIDNFKTINDTWGHSIGDEIIIACGQAIRSNFRSSDLIARIGGDEFAVFYKSPASRDDVESRAQSVCETVRGIVVTCGAKLTVSLGVAIVDGCARHNYQDLYVVADNALYGLKESGRDGFRIEQSPQHTTIG